MVFHVFGHAEHNGTIRFTLAQVLLGFFEYGQITLFRGGVKGGQGGQKNFKKFFSVFWGPNAQSESVDGWS